MSYPGSSHGWRGRARLYICVDFISGKLDPLPSTVSNWGKEIMDSVLTLRLIAAIFVVIGVVLMFFETGLAIEQ